MAVTGLTLKAGWRVYSFDHRPNSRVSMIPDPDDDRYGRCVWSALEGWGGHMLRDAHLALRARWALGKRPS